MVIELYKPEFRGLKWLLCEGRTSNETWSHPIATAEVAKIEPNGRVRRFRITVTGDFLAPNQNIGTHATNPFFSAERLQPPGSGQSAQDNSVSMFAVVVLFQKLEVSCQSFGVRHNLLKVHVNVRPMKTRECMWKNKDPVSELCCHGRKKGKGRWYEQYRKLR